MAAVICPKGGVGKTTSTFVLGSLLADRLRLRVVALDANPDFGTLAALAPDRVRCPRSLADLLADIEAIHTATQLRGYMTAMPSGLHLLGAPADPPADGRAWARRPTANCWPCWAPSTTWCCSTSAPAWPASWPSSPSGAPTRSCWSRTPEWVTSSAVLAALDHLEHEHTTVAVNKLHARGPGDLRELERRLRERRPAPHPGHSL